MNTLTQQNKMKKSSKTQHSYENNDHVKSQNYVKKLTKHQCSKCEEVQYMIVETNRNSVIASSKTNVSNLCTFNTTVIHCKQSSCLATNHLSLENRESRNNL